ncbi:dihydrofolate reductase [Mycoplasmopsis glycophila]|uniref:dihydrofolate reductase n=1 Tax=Mycoplasmopsis glycophila TaxID=171285 RepID=A0A449AVJ9_9BACT|nr:dihydrofolate reductase [Mycoplasmopsis glycophila]VEU70561.1 Dihydrofolate reductase [Mycoplasmopsis glycophila]
MIKMIFAATKSGVIGLDQSLPWKIKNELNYFKNYTKDASLFMGSKTLLSLPKTFQKENRQIYSFATNNKEYDLLIDFYLKDEKDLVAMFEKFQNSKETLCIIGGKEIFEKYWFLADEISFSLIKKEYKGNVIFNSLHSSLIDPNYKLFEDNEFIVYLRNLKTDPIWIWFQNQRISSRELKEHFFLIKKKSFKI